jgi:DNA-binding transcriptional MocR family regulator
LPVFRYQHLCDELRHGIQTERWQAGEKLPSIRALCKLYQLSLATVQHALHRLEAEGLLQAVAKTGYFVCKTASTQAVAASRAVSTTSTSLTEPAAVTVPQLWFELMNRGAAFDLYPAGPSSTLPYLTLLYRQLGKAMRASPYQNAMYYDEPAGSAQLRFQLKEHYRSIGLELDAAELVISAGCQHALFLALSACCQPGDTVAVEAPAFYGVLQLLQQLQLKALPIPCCPVAGLDVAALSQALLQWPIKACVVSPAFATPTGACLPLPARHALIALANLYDFTLIEDDIYGDLGFHQRPLPLKSLDTEQRVILCSSFTKSLSRDLRIGWIAAGKWQPAVLKLKLVSQLASSPALQQGIAAFMAEGYYKRHLLKFRQQLQQQRDQLIQALQQYFPADCQYSIPSGGLALWLQLPKPFDTVALYQQCLAHGIYLTPGRMFATSPQFDHCLRLSFAHPLTGSRLQALQQVAGLLHQRSSECS